MVYRDTGRLNWLESLGQGGRNGWMEDEMRRNNFRDNSVPGWDERFVLSRVKGNEKGQGKKTFRSFLLFENCPS